MHPYNSQGMGTSSLCYCAFINDAGGLLPIVPWHRMYSMQVLHSQWMQDKSTETSTSTALAALKVE